MLREHGNTSLQNSKSLLKPSEPPGDEYSATTVEKKRDYRTTPSKNVSELFHRENGDLMDEESRDQ
jgi:hypothetical protein